MKGWRTRTIACGHDVMLDLPNELTDLSCRKNMDDVLDASEATSKSDRLLDGRK
jgi:hypothetical protein